MVTMETIKIGMSAVTGRVSGAWNSKAEKFEVKRGMAKNGTKYQIFEIGVSTKNQDGTYTNGKNIPVMMFGEVKVEAGDNVGLVGRFAANNYTNAEGKEIRGLQFMCNAEDMFEPAAWDKKPEESKPAEEKQDELPEW